MSRERLVFQEIASRNENVWVIGYTDRGFFKIRKVVWGDMLARAERRESEEVRRAVVVVTGKAQMRSPS